MSEWPGVSERLAGAKLVVLSLGIGVQSCALLYMAEAGLIGPRPDFALFADTQWEPPWVYEYLEYLRQQTTIPIFTTTKGDLRRAITHGKSTVIPAFVAGKDGKAAPLNRNCTRDYKVAPLERFIRERLGIVPGNRAPRIPVVEKWIGISLDEIERLKVSRRPWIQNRFPLVEERMSRDDCLLLFDRLQKRRPKKSACGGCPFHGDAEWRVIRADPATWADACAVDEALRDATIMRTTAKPMFLHRSLVPLARAPIDNPDSGQPSLFSGECEGMCGV